MEGIFSGDGMSNDDFEQTDADTVDYDDPWVTSFVSAQLLNYYRDGDFTDVTLKAGTVCIDAHRIILCAASAFFKAEFRYARNAGSSGQCDTIELQCDGDVLKNVIDYIYSGTIRISQGNVVSLMELEDYLQIVSLKNLISHFLNNILNKDSKVCAEVIHLKKPLELFRYYDLASEIFLRIRKQFGALLELPDFLDIPIELLLECLRSDFLVYVSEDDLLIGLCKWMRANSAEQSAYESLMEHVDPSCIRWWNDTKDKALSVVKDNPKLQSNLIHWFEISEQTRLNSGREGRSHYKNVLKPVLMSLGGVGPDDSGVATVGCILACYSENWRPMIPTIDDDTPQRDNAIAVPLMLHPRIRPWVACDGRNVYVAGGGSRSVEVYNSLKNEWSPLPDVPIDLRPDIGNGAMALLDGSLYLLTDLSSPRTTAFMVLHENSSQWHRLVCPVVPGEFSDRDFMLVSSLSSLYLFFRGSKQCKIVRRYDVNMDVWSVFSVCPLASVSYCCSCVAYYHMIFIIFNGSILFSFNTITQKWTEKGDNRPGDPYVFDRFASSKFGYNIVLVNEPNTRMMTLFGLTGRKSKWLNTRRMYSGLAYFNLGLYSPPPK